MSIPRNVVPVSGPRGLVALLQDLRRRKVDGLPAWWEGLGPARPVPDTLSPDRVEAERAAARLLREAAAHDLRDAAELAREMDALGVPAELHPRSDRTGLHYARPGFLLPRAAAERRDLAAMLAGALADPPAELSLRPGLVERLTAVLAGDRTLESRMAELSVRLSEAESAERAARRAEP